MPFSGDVEGDEDGLITSLPDFPETSTAASESTNVNDLIMGEQLTADQQVELQQHKIILTDDTPCFQTPYHELLDMVQNDIIQFDDTTPYCSPLIVVKK